MIVSEQTDEDWPEVWRVLKPAFRDGLSYPLPTDVQEKEAFAYWLKSDGFNGVARDVDGKILGVYFLRPDQGGPGAHICNAGYVVAEEARGRGVGTAMCLESQTRAVALGFRGMKFNLVVTSNDYAVRAWQKAGMEIIATTPGAFLLPDGHYTDAYIMFKRLSQ